MPFDRIFLDELSARNDIVEIVSQYVQLKRAARTISVCDPFHNEKPVRFTVLRRTSRSFTCFGCGAGAVSLPLL